MINTFRIKALAILFAASILLTGCFTQRHVIGEGPQSGEVEEVRQWFVLWGLVPINEVDSADMTYGTANYEIKTEYSAVDVIIGIFTGLVSVFPRTVTITR